MDRDDLHPSREHDAEQATLEDIIAAEEAERVSDAEEARAERLDEDDRLKPEFVEAVREALQDDAETDVRDLVEPLHPADIADLF